MGGKGFLSIILDADTRRYKKGMSKARMITARFGASIKSLAGAAGVVGVAAGVAALGKQAITAASDLEVMETQFTALTGSAEEAGKVMQELVNFTAKTPFQLEGVAGASRQLLAAGVSTKDLSEELKVLGDLAAVTNVPLGDMAKIYSKAMNKGKLQAEELNQLSERGIPIMKELASMYGVTKNEIFDMASKGKIGFSDLQQAMVNMTSEGGIANDAMEKLSQTSAGMYSTFKDNLNLTLAELGKEVLPLINAGLEKMNELMSDGGTGGGIHGRIAANTKLRDGLKEEIALRKREITHMERNKNLFKSELKVAYNDLLRLQLELNEANKDSIKLLNETETSIDDLSGSIDNNTDSLRAGKKAVEEFYTAWELGAHKALRAAAPSFGALDVPELEPMDDTDLSAMESVTMEVKKQQIAWQDLAVGVGFAGQAVGAFSALASAAAGDDAKKRYTNALFAAGIGVPLAFIQGLTTSGGNPVIGAAYAALAGIQLAAVRAAKPPSFARGTSFHSGGLATVHEGETINLPRGTSVESKGKTKQGRNLVFASTKFDGRDLWLVNDNTSKVQNLFRP